MKPLRGTGFSLWLGVSVLALALAGCANEEAAETAQVHLKDESGRKMAPSFELPDANGKMATLAEYKGKVVVLNFWATWCGPCRVEMPWFAEFENKYKDRGFAMLGVSLDEEGWDVVKPYLEEHKDVDYRILLGDEQMATLYGGIESLPTTYVIDQEGRIASVHMGLVSKSTYVKEIEALLEKTSAKDSGSEPAHRELAFRTN